MERVPCKICVTRLVGTSSFRASSAALISSASSSSARCSPGWTAVTAMMDLLVIVHHLVIPGWIGRDVLRRERLRDSSVLPRQNSAAFPMRLAAGVLQELPVYFAATSDGALHSGSI